MFIQLIMLYIILCKVFILMWFMSHNYTFGFTIAGNFALVVVYYIEFDNIKKATLSFTLLSY